MAASAFAHRLAAIALGLAMSTTTAAAASKGIWISRDEIMTLPMSGPAWTALKKQADQPADASIGERAARVRSRSRDGHACASSNLSETVLV